MNIPGTKITKENITFGPVEPDEFTVWFFAGDLNKQGYRRVSNNYCLVARIDREDWLEVLAKQRHCSVADFYNVDGSGIGANHKDHYIRVHSKDVHTVHPDIYKKVLKYD
mgnify:CR=1 FL=1